MCENYYDVELCKNYSDVSLDRRHVHTIPLTLDQTPPVLMTSSEPRSTKQEVAEFNSASTDRQQLHQLEQEQQR
jgi:hypothetical protein